jgi:parallel beta-helix repeat protein
MSFVGGDYTDFLNATETQIYGGAEEPLPARIVGPTQEPFTNIFSANQLGIVMTGVNSGLVMPVIFQAGDFVTIGGISSLTVSKLAARINATLATYGVTYAAATNENGYLNVVSAFGADMSTGVGASVTLTETGFTAGIIQKLGFGAVSSVTASGSAPTRGIITESADGRGGHFPLRYTNGESVLSQTTNLIGWVDSSSRIKAWPNIVGGQTIYGRLSRTSTPSWKLSFFANGYQPPTVTSIGGNFCALTAADTIRFQVSGIDPIDGNSFSILTTVNFNLVINSVVDVVNAINAAWWTASGSGQGTMVSSLPEPYVLESTDSIYIRVDGSTAITVTFSAADGPMTAKSVVDAINAAWTLAGQPGVLAYVHVIGGLNYVKLVSQTVSGPTSSVEVAGARTAINKIGFPYGKVTGSNLVSVYGQSELRVLVPIIDVMDGGGSVSMFIMNMLGSAKTLLGLGHVTSWVYASVQEIEATPIIYPDTSGSVGINMLIPEVMELGEVPLDEMTTLQEFVNQDTVQQVRTWAGATNANRPVVYDRNGRVSKNAAAGMVYDVLEAKGVVLGSDQSNNYTPRLNIPFRYDAAAVDVVTALSESFATPSNVASASPVTQAFRKYVVNNQTLTHDYASWNAKRAAQWEKDIDGRVAAAMSFDSRGNFAIAIRDAANNAPWSVWDRMPFTIDLSTPDSPTLYLRGSSATISTPDSRMTLIDANISGNTVGENHVSAYYNGGQFLRIADRDATELDDGYSLMHSVNARASVTCGDGVNTFGDFNGTNAISSAINFIETNVSPNANATIYVKKGVYKASSPINTSLNLSIIGVAQADDTASCTIYNPSSIGDTLTITRSGNNGSLHLKNVNLLFDISGVSSRYSLVLVDGATVVAEDCSIKQTKIENPIPQSESNEGVCGRPAQGVFRRCRMSNIGLNGRPILTFNNVVSGNSFVFENCMFKAINPNTQCVQIRAANSLTTLSVFDGLRFVGCDFSLSYATKTGNNLTANTGLIDLHPGLDANPGENDVRINKGLLVKNIVFRDCKVRVGSPSSGINVLLHLIPTANGTNANVVGTPFTYVDNLVFENTSFTHTPPTVNGNPNAFTIAYGARSVVIINCKYELTGSGLLSAHGIATHDVAWALHGGLSNGGASGDPQNAWASAPDTPWGTIAIMADDVKIDKFDVTGLLQKCSTIGASTWYEGDAYILYGRTLSIKDVTCSYETFAGATSRSYPIHRWRLFNLMHESMTGSGVTYEPSGTADGLVLIGKQSLSTSDPHWALLSFIRLHAKNIHLTNSSVTGFKTDGGDPSDGCGALVSIEGNGLWYSPYMNGMAKITNSVFRDTGYGIRYDYFETVHGAMNFDISGNTITGCEEYGIRLRISYSGYGTVSKNYVSNCDKPGMGFFYDLGYSNLNIVDNIFIDNYPTDGELNCRQIHIYPLYTSSTRSPKVFLDRNTAYETIKGGGIGITLLSGGSPAGLPATGSISTIYGAETGLNAFPATYRWTPAALMVRNPGYLVTPSPSI